MCSHFRKFMHFSWLPMSISKHRFFQDAFGAEIKYQRRHDVITSTLRRRHCYVMRPLSCFSLVSLYIGWSGGAMVLGKLPVPRRPTFWMRVGQGPIALAVGAGRRCLDVFTPLYLFSPLSPSLWETVRHRLKYCLKMR